MVCGGLHDSSDDVKSDGKSRAFERETVAARNRAPFFHATQHRKCLQITRSSIRVSGYAQASLTPNIDVHIMA
ncbi:hypothetical protein CUJ87_26645 [Paraburkholderia caledonica]|nr:hypothetical protein CUJ87_26645 [Paraburkholderia caledonica]